MGILPEITKKMKTLVKIIIISSMVNGLISCNTSVEKSKEVILDQKQKIFIGEWDNFQQYWLENTAESKHRVETDDKHRHFSLRISEKENSSFLVALHEGRNGKHLVEEMTFSEVDLSSSDFKIDKDTLWIGNRKQFKNKDPYKFVRVRKFSGWIEYPMESESNGVYHQGNLEIHDQGGMVELDVEGVDYTVELTQLLFAKKLAIMKLAIYDIPMDSVGINSRSISYTWSNPDSKRIGINLRKVVSGWTFIEPGYINSDNTNFKKK